MIHKPTLQEAILMAIYASTDDGDIQLQKGNNECCASQLTELVSRFSGIKRHPRSNHYSLNMLVQKGLIRVSRRETLEDAHINGRGKRTYYKLTESGEKVAKFHFEIFQENFKGF